VDSPKSKVLASHLSSTMELGLALEMGHRLTESRYLADSQRYRNIRAARSNQSPSVNLKAQALHSLVCFRLQAALSCV
jgi:hypothetical protein